MTKKRKVFGIVSITMAIMIVSGFSFVMITGASGFNGGFGHRFHRRGMPPFMHKEISSFMLWRLDNGVEKLDLSKNQQKEYDTFRSKLQGTMESGIDKKLNFKQHAMQEFKKDAPDLSIIAEQAQADLQHMSALLSENLGLFTNFYNSLDDKQKSTITKRIKERMENHRNYNSCYKKEV